MPRITTSAEDLPLQDRLTGKIFGVNMLDVLNERDAEKAAGITEQPAQS